MRDAITDYIQFLEDVFQSYRPIESLLVDALRRARATRIVDLCSGGGGPWKSLGRYLEKTFDKSPSVVLTDLYPNDDSFEFLKNWKCAHLSYSPRSVDVTRVPADLTGFRTLFTSFHHFQPETARAILKDAVFQGQGIGIFEITNRSVITMLLEIPAQLAIFFLAPSLRPFRWSRLVFTYLIPIIPLVLLNDALVSCLRTYTTKELRDLVLSLGETKFTWRIGAVKTPNVPMKVTYLIGLPATVAPAQDATPTSLGIPNEIMMDD